jgi:hypothetical protein
MTQETKSGYMACPQYEGLLEDYLNGALCDANVAVAAQHLEACPQCSRAADAALASTRWLRETHEALGRPPQPSPAFPRIVMARIRAAEAAQTAEGDGFWRTLVSLGRTVTVTATLAVALLAAYEARWARAPQPVAASARLTEVPYLFSPDPVRLPANEGEALVMVTETDHANY